VSRAEGQERLALVAGASGVVGRRLAQHLAARGWPVLALSRKPPADVAAKHLAVDLLDATEASARLAGATGITHVFYAVRHDHAENAPEPEPANARMLRNLLDALEPRAPRLAHVNLVHGSKYYGHHVGPIALPAVEDGPRGPAQVFYFAQEDLVRRRAAGARWSWSIARPHILCDEQTPHPRSIALVIAVLAAVQRELGEPLFFPGSEKSFQSRTQFTDPWLLAHALEWMATDPRCGNHAFNVVNGDHPRWSELWPALAAHLGVTPGQARAIWLADYVRDKAPLWDRVVARHGLRPAPLSRVALWAYGDYVFAPEWDIISSVDKARRFGFSERVDTREMFARLFAAYRGQRIIP